MTTPNLLDRLAQALQGARDMILTAEIVTPENDGAYMAIELALAAYDTQAHTDQPIAQDGGEGGIVDEHDVGGINGPTEAAVSCARQVLGHSYVVSTADMRAALRAVWPWKALRVAQPLRAPDTAELTIELLREVIDVHRTSGRNGYNECEEVECAWCTDAKQIIAALGTPPPQPRDVRAPDTAPKGDEITPLQESEIRVAAREEVLEELRAKDELVEKLIAAEAENARNAKDAERYHFLRDTGPPDKQTGLSDNFAVVFGCWRSRAGRLLFGRRIRRRRRRGEGEGAVSEDTVHAQSFIVHGDDWFFVDTYDRGCSAVAAHGDRYAETQVWEWLLPQRERGKLLATYSGCRGSIRNHLETCELIHRAGREGLS